MKKIAVVLRGHMRTWNFCKHQTFQQLESRYPNIDWYFSTWEESLSTERRRKLEQDFQGRNFQLYLSKNISEHGSEYSSWFGPGKLCEQVAPDILKHDYACVIETRPDVYLDIKQSLPDIENNALYVTGLDLVYTLVPGYERMDHHYGAQDWFFIFSPEVFQIYSQRRHRPGPQDSHGDIIRIAKENNISLFNLQQHLTTIMVRPNMFQHPDSFEWVWGHGEHWITMSREERMHYLSIQDIDVRDYMTSNSTISL